MDGFVHQEFVPPGQVLLAMQLCRGWAMQFGGNDTKSGRDSGSWNTITHWATNHSLCKQFLAQKDIPVITQPPHSPDLTLSFGRSLLWKWAPRGHVSQWRTWNRTRRPYSRRCSNNGRIDRAIVCARARVLFWRSGMRCSMLYHYSAIPPFRDFFFYCPTHIFEKCVDCTAFLLVTTDIWRFIKHTLCIQAEDNEPSTFLRSAGIRGVKADTARSSSEGRLWLPRLRNVNNGNESLKHWSKGSRTRKKQEQEPSVIMRLPSPSISSFVLHHHTISCY
jgi:hypothetical protein